MDVENIELYAPRPSGGEHVLALRNTRTHNDRTMPMARLRARGRAIDGHLYPGIPTSPDVLNSQIRGDEAMNLKEVKLEFGQSQGILQSFASDFERFWFHD